MTAFETLSRYIPVYIHISVYTPVYIHISVRYAHRCGDEDIRGALFKAFEVLVDVCAPYDHLCSEGRGVKRDLIHDQKRPNTWPKET